MKRLVIVAASTVVRAGLEALAASIPGFLVVGAFPDSEGVEDLQPDVILTTEGWEQSPKTALVVLGDGAEAAWSAEAVRHGVRAVLPSTASQETILSAVDAASNGLALVDPDELESWLGARRQTAVPEETDLTAREQEVLRMMADGAANKAIAWKLGVSEHTVKFHVASILAKLGAGTRTEAVSMGMRRGLIPL
jgi:NarL family two-component system response regulator YdfI